MALSYDVMVIYTDGSAIKTPFIEKAAWSLVASDGSLDGGRVTRDPTAEGRRGANKCTIMAAELTGILKALEFLLARHARAQLQIAREADLRPP